MCPFKYILVIEIENISGEIVLKWMSWEFFYGRAQCWYNQWLGANRQQAITWSSVDPDQWCKMTSLGQNELIIQLQCIYRNRVKKKM